MQHFVAASSLGSQSPRMVTGRDHADLGAAVEGDHHLEVGHALEGQRVVEVDVGLDRVTGAGVGDGVGDEGQGRLGVVGLGQEEDGCDGDKDGEEEKKKGDEP